MSRVGRDSLRVILVVALLLLGFVPSVPPADQAATPIPSASASSTAAVSKHVLVVSVDGLKPKVISRLGRSALPAYHRLIRQGASTLNARSAVERTLTMPNHTGMMTGRRVTTVRGHGVTFNYDNGRTVHEMSAAPYVSSLFDVVHDRGGSTSLYTAKSKFRFFVRTWNRDGRSDTIGPDNGSAKIDSFLLARDATLVNRVKQRLLSAPDTLTFLHLAGPDAAGHKYGFGSAQYRGAVRATDRQVGILLRTIAGSSRLRTTTTVILTSDHGGVGRGHGAAARRVNFTVPFMVWGAGVAKGRNLYALNSDDRRRPGSRRLASYAGRQPIRNAEVANLATDLLGWPRVPGSQLNANQSLDVS